MREWEMQTITTQTVLMTPKETAARLRVSESTLAKWRMTASRTLPFVKIGAKVANDEREVEKWLSGQLRKSTIDKGAPSSDTRAV
jgi:excisionase family DNA binding protein